MTMTTEFDEPIEGLMDVLDYVRREGSCEPASARLLTKEDDDCPVYLVKVKEWVDWKVPPPEFFFVCTMGATNLYRSDVFRPQPWLDEQEISTLVDYVKSFHTGLMRRMGF